MPDTSSKSCSIVIRCYNEERHVGRLLSGIMQQTVKNPEIILVDSGSTDATLSIASRYPVKVLTIRPEDFSFGRSLNIGCRAATRDFIVIPSAHVYPVYCDWLEKMLGPFSDPKVALVYGKQRGCDTTKYAEHQIFAKWFPETGNPRQTHPFCNNANAAIRRELWEELPYDEELTGLEDLGWANRVIEMGHYLVYVPEAEIIHVHDETPTQTYNRYRREAIAMKHIFPEEKFGLWDFARLFLANVFSDYRHAIRDGVMMHEVSAIPLFRLMQFWGTYRGFSTTGVTSRLKQTFYYPHNGLAPGSPGPTEDARQKVDYRTVEFKR